MKKPNCFIYSITVYLLLSGCGSTKIEQIGKVNMISNRNVDTKFEYKPLKTYASLSKKQLKQTKHITIEEAIDNVVKSVPGGEFMMNVKIYLVDNKYFAAEGDVWGGDSKEILGFKVGDKVQWKSLTGTKSGTITGLIDNEECMVLENGDVKSKKMKYEDLVKIR